MGIPGDGGDELYAAVAGDDDHGHLSFWRGDPGMWIFRGCSMFIRGCGEGNELKRPNKLKVEEVFVPSYISPLPSPNPPTLPPSYDCFRQSHLLLSSLIRHHSHHSSQVKTKCPMI